MKIYCFSGLGTDDRVFKNLKTEHELIYIPWSNPFPKESMENYAMRMGENIDKSNPFALLGVSYGGMIASCLSHQLNPVKTFIISSAASRKEFPFKMKLFRYFPLALIPAKQFIPPFWIVSRFFGVRKGQPSYFLLKEIINDTNPQTVKWAVYQIIKWRQENVAKNIVRIHSKHDKLLPKRKHIDYDHVLNGGHFMIVEKTAAISAIINNEIAKDQKLTP